MSSIVIKGNTSGQIELAAPDVAGSTTLTLPTGSGTVLLSDGDGSNLTNLPTPAALSTASGSAPSYSARAWVNWSITQTIRGSGNVSSITDNGVGRYTVNMTTAMPDTNYSVTMAVGDDSTSQLMYGLGNNSYTPSFTTSSFTVYTSNATPTFQDKDYTHVVVFR